MTKLKAKKQGKVRQAKGKPPKRGSSWLVWLLVVVAIVGAAAVAFALIRPTEQPFMNSLGKPKAAIVDQLYTLHANQVFTEQTTKSLEDFGFEVDVYRGDDVTVNLYRELPAYDYKLIIFRVHSGVLEVDSRASDTTWMFTNEPYSKVSYFAEQLSDRVTHARTHDDAPLVFAISAKFIWESVGERFNNTVIVMMGCDGLLSMDLAEAFIARGASTYIAWDYSVRLDYVDTATPFLVDRLCGDRLTIEQAVAQTMQEIRPDPEYGSVLHYFPAKVGDRTIKQLIR